MHLKNPICNSTNIFTYVHNALLHYTKNVQFLQILHKKIAQILQYSRS